MLGKENSGKVSKNFIGNIYFWGVTLKFCSDEYVVSKLHVIYRLARPAVLISAALLRQVRPCSSLQEQVEKLSIPIKGKRLGAQSWPEIMSWPGGENNRVYWLLTDFQIWCLIQGFTTETGRFARSPFRPRSFRPKSKSFRPKSESFRPNLKSFRPNFKVVSFKVSCDVFTNC